MSAVHPNVEATDLAKSASTRATGGVQQYYGVRAVRIAVPGKRTRSLARARPRRRRWMWRAPPRSRTGTWSCRAARTRSYPAPQRPKALESENFPAQPAPVLHTAAAELLAANSCTCLDVQEGVSGQASESNRCLAVPVGFTLCLSCWVPGRNHVIEREPGLVAWHRAATPSSNVQLSICQPPFGRKGRIVHMPWS